MTRERAAPGGHHSSNVFPVASAAAAAAAAASGHQPAVLSSPLAGSPLATLGTQTSTLMPPSRVNLVACGMQERFP